MPGIKPALLTLSLLALLLPGGAFAQGPAPTPAPAPKKAPLPESSLEKHRKEKMRLPAFDLLGSESLWRKLGIAAPEVKVGRWMEYASSAKNENETRVAISILKEEGLDPETERVMEVRQVDPTGDRTYYKLLLRRAKKGDKIWQLGGLQVKVPAFPLMTFPLGQASEQMEGEILHADQQFDDFKIEVVSEKTQIEVQAGVFQVRHLRLVPKTKGKTKEAPVVRELWVDIEGRVPVYPIVKARDGDRITTLVDLGDGARADLPPITAAIH